MFAAWLVLLIHVYCLYTFVLVDTYDNRNVFAVPKSLYNDIYVKYYISRLLLTKIFVAFAILQY